MCRVICLIVMIAVMTGIAFDAEAGFKPRRVGGPVVTGGAGTR